MNRAVVGFAAAMILFGLAERLLSPTVPAIVSDLAPERLRRRADRRSGAALTTGLSSGPALAGIALDAGAGAGLLAGVLAAALAAASVGFARR